MSYFYNLHSDLIDKFFVGSTRDHVESRLYRHNNKHKGFTSASQDWRIIYQEYFEKYNDAHKREMEIKSWKSKIRIQELIQQA